MLSQILYFITHQLEDKMDHRQKPRVDNVKKVSIFKNDMLDSNTYAINYSDQGMYVVTDGFYFPKDSSIEITFTDEYNLKHHHSGRIVHRDLYGIGIEFDNIQKKAC